MFFETRRNVDFESENLLSHFEIEYLQFEKSFLNKIFKVLQTET